jgi:hypothetical protein
VRLESRLRPRPATQEWLEDVIPSVAVAVAIDARVWRRHDSYKATGQETLRDEARAAWGDSKVLSHGAIESELFPQLTVSAANDLPFRVATPAMSSRARPQFWTKSLWGIVMEKSAMKKKNRGRSGKLSKVRVGRGPVPGEPPRRGEKHPFQCDY